MSSKARKQFKAKLRKQRLGPKPQKPPKLARRIKYAMPTCGVPNCGAVSSFVVRPRGGDKAGTFLATCGNCVEAVVASAERKGLASDVITHAELRQMVKNKSG